MFVRHVNSEAARFSAAASVVFTLLLVDVVRASTPVAPATTKPAASAAADANWPQWRGPLGSGVAPLADPPTT
ncbi:MAG: hypothetical protein WBD40_14625, partial [Tepidisphaeraceae bacterium]